MGNGFSHFDVFSVLKRNFPKLFKKETGVDFEFGNESQRKEGKGDDELLVFEIEGIASINGRARDERVPIAFIENKSGEMEVKVGTKTVHNVKRMKGMSKELLKDLTRGIREYIQTHR